MIVLIAEVIGSLPNCMSAIEEQRLSTYNIQNAFTWWWAVWWEQLLFSFARLSMVNTKMVTILTTLSLFASSKLELVYESRPLVLVLHWAWWAPQGFRLQTKGDLFKPSPPPFSLQKLKNVVEPTRVRCSSIKSFI